MVNVSKNSLINALQHVLRAISASKPIPILSGILIQVFENKLRLTASNTSMTIRCTLSQDHHFLEVYRAGYIVVHARYFHEVIRKLTIDTVTLELKDNFILNIQSGNSHIRLCGMNPEEFPTLHPSEHLSASKFRIHNGLFKSSIKQMSAVASTSEMRPILTGVSLEYKYDSLNLIATDGVRLASRTIPIDNTLSFAGAKFIIPAKNLIEVSKMIRNDEDAVEIDVGGHQIRFSTNELQIDSALIDGIYPSVTNVIPQVYSSELVVDTTALLHAVECVLILAGESIIRLVASGNELALSSREAGIGDVQDAVSIIRRFGEDVSISLNGKYFLEMLRCMDSECVKLRFAGAVSPIVIIPEENGSSALFLITPVRTHG